jgi:hypothetical protein
MYELLISPVHAACSTHHICQPSVTSCLLGPYILSTLFSNTLQLGYVLPLEWENKIDEIKILNILISCSYAF